MKEYILKLGHRNVGKLFVDNEQLLHIECYDSSCEYVTLEQFDVSQVTEVLLSEENEPKYIQIPVRYLSDSTCSSRNLVVSVYSRYRSLDARIYIHDVDNPKMINFVYIDSIMTRNLRNLPTLEVSDQDTEEKTPEYTIAERLRYFRKKSRLSGYELSKLAGISVTITNGIEKGRICNPSYLTILALCNALEISLVEFFSNDIMNEHELNESLLDEIKLLSCSEQIRLARMLKERRINSD